MIVGLFKKSSSRATDRDRGRRDRRSEKLPSAIDFPEMLDKVELSERLSQVQVYLDIYLH